MREYAVGKTIAACRLWPNGDTRPPADPGTGFGHFSSCVIREHFSTYNSGQQVTGTSVGGGE